MSETKYEPTRDEIVHGLGVMAFTEAASGKARQDYLVALHHLALEALDRRAPEGAETALLKPEDCPHDEHHVHCAVSYLADANRTYADISLKCAKCGTPYRFLNPRGGMLLNDTAVNPDQTELRCPVAPGAGSVADMPPMRFQFHGKVN